MSHFPLAKAQADREKLEGLKQTPAQQVPQGPVRAQSLASSQALILALSLTHHIFTLSLIPGC